MAKIEFNLTDLLIVFDELLDMTDEETGQYWFSTTRSDGCSITLLFLAYEGYVSASIASDANTAMAVIRMRDCSAIRVLDEKKKIVEIVNTKENGRCTLSLITGNVLVYEEPRS